MTTSSPSSSDSSDIDDKQLARTKDSSELTKDNQNSIAASTEKAAHNNKTADDDLKTSSVS